MCLFTQETVKVAEDDIITYKVITKPRVPIVDYIYISAYRGTPIIFNKVIRATLENYPSAYMYSKVDKVRNEEKYNRKLNIPDCGLMVSKGMFHSFKYLETALATAKKFTEKDKVQYFVIKARIPKNTLYIEGVNQDGEACLASEFIYYYTRQETDETL